MVDPVPVVPRNAPCPCGSGERYKNCHGALAAAAAAPPAGSEGDATVALAAARRALAAGDRAVAARRGRELLARVPDLAAGWVLLGEALRPGDPAGAEAAWRSALALAPEDAEANFHLGNVLRERDEHAAAAAHYAAALRAAPGHPAVLNNLGLVQEKLGERRAAEASYRTVLAADAVNADALGNLANLLFADREFAAAEDLYARLFVLMPSPPAFVWLQRGYGLMKLFDYAGAETCIRRADELAPGDDRVKLNLAACLMEQNRYGEAVPLLEPIVGAAPDNGWALSLLCRGKQLLGDWDGLDAHYAALRELLVRHGEHGASMPAALDVLTMPIHPRELRAAARGAVLAEIRADAVAPPPRALAAGDRLRVGFLSSDLRGHAITFLALEHWEMLRGGRLETFAYMTLPDASGALGERVRGAFDHYVNVQAESDAAIAARLRADGIDVLCDCNGHTAHARYGVLARRPVPLQLNYLGFPGTLGSPWTDYVLVDRRGMPPELEPFFDERPLLMPNSAFPCDTKRRPPGPPPSRAAEGLPAAGFVFACFNHAAKIQPSVFSVWMRILRAVDGSVLWLYGRDPVMHANLRREAAARGVDPARLFFAQPRSVTEHLARQPLADLFLDTLPYGAHTTANDALLMGLPIVTCTGPALASRICGSHLHAAGLPELVTDNHADYEALAIALARDPARLAALRARLEANRATAPLFDMPRYNRDFEDALYAAWAAHRARTAASR